MHAIEPPAASYLDDPSPRCTDRHRGSDIIRSRAYYVLTAILVFIGEVVIAAFVHDAFIRPYLGDSLAVVLVYLALRATTPLGIGWSAVTALAIACAIEVGQGIGLVGILGLEDYRVARVVLGTGFDPRDFLAYAGGGAAVIMAEAALRR